MVNEKALIAQSDLTVLLETKHPRAEAAREAISSFAELWKSPDGLHTYRITPLSLWNAAAAGMTADDMLASLEQHAKFGVPGRMVQEIRSCVTRYGMLRLEKWDGRLYLDASDRSIVKQIAGYESLRHFWPEHAHSVGFLDRLEVQLKDRGAVKQELMKLGYPVMDLAGYEEGEAVSIALRDELSSSGAPFQLRPYQEDAIEAFYRGGSASGGSGIIVLPCGAGKTVVGIGAMSRLGRATLILTTNTTSVKQWKAELLDKTHLTENEIGEYGSDRKEVRKVTIATYQMITHRRTKQDEFLHMKLFHERHWGLIVYDEVHLLPAPVFRATAEIQATRRLGLTATLVREDGREEDVFSLVGPKRMEVPWKRLERQGWIAKVECAEIRVPMPDDALEAYRKAASREQHRLAGENPAKAQVVKQLLREHEGRPALVIGQYLEQLHMLSTQLNAPVITGEVPQAEREQLYAQFKRGELPVLLVSKVANFAVDLPGAAVAIQVSGSYGSRQEEAQRLGRVLRPKPGDNTAYFYTIVSAETKELGFSAKRQRFLVEQGYRYRQIHAETGHQLAGREGERAG